MCSTAWLLSGKSHGPGSRGKRVQTERRLSSRKVVGQWKKLAVWINRAFCLTVSYPLKFAPQIFCFAFVL
jgi:hypothetical protein